MIEELLSYAETSFSELNATIMRGYIQQDCQLNFLDKLNNVKFEKTVVFINSVTAIKHLNNDRIVGIITNKSVAEKLETKSNIGIWIDEDPEELFYLLHEKLVQECLYFKPWVNSIAASATISPNAKLADHSISIGEGCIVEDNVVIKPFTIIGNDSILRSSCDIGSDGFEAHRIGGRLRIIRHGGLILIGNNVEIQSLVTLSRGLFPSRNTIICDNVKIADLVHVAHGVHIGEGTMITAGCTIAGNSSIGAYVFIGPGAVISNRICIGDNASISIGSVVVRNVKPNTKVSGNFAYDHNRMLSNYTKMSVE